MRYPESLAEQQQIDKLIEMKNEAGLLGLGRLEERRCYLRKLERNQNRKTERCERMKKEIGLDSLRSIIKSRKKN